MTISMRLRDAPFEEAPYKTITMQKYAWDVYAKYILG